MARAALVMQAVFAEMPRGRVSALVLGEGALAQGLGVAEVVPLLSLGLKRSDLNLTGAELRLASMRSDRAARRFCDRLVALRAVRESTGRETFGLFRF